ncbi:MAG TPA: glutathione-disulfide reductase [Sphingomonas sp.]
MADYDFDLFVIGAGSGGVRASRVAAAHGAKVALAEEYRLGGTCVIRGCVPKKLLVYAAQFAEDLKDARRFGWRVPDCDFEWPVLRDHVLGEVDRLEGLYGNTLESNGVTILRQRATVTGPHEIETADGTRHTARIILIATGAKPAIPVCDGSELGFTSNEAFHLDALPRRIVIAGGGYIANEFAGVFNEYGSHVTLLTRGGDILRGYDAALRERLLQISIKKGIDFRFHAQIMKIEQQADGSLLVHAGDLDPIATDAVMFATGRDPNSSGLGLEVAGVEMDAVGAIRVDADSRTNIPSIFAIGDVTNRVQLTPVAIREGHAFADSQFGGNPRQVDYDCIPSAVFSHPPLAAVGLTEAEARARYGTVKVYISDFRAMKNVLANRDERSLYKMVVEEVTGRVLGLHMIGPDSPEILQAAAIAVKAGLTKAQFDDTVALHPTMAEELVLLK